MSFSYKKYCKSLLEKEGFGALAEVIDPISLEIGHLQQGQLGKAMLNFVDETLPEFEGDEISLGHLV